MEIVTTSIARLARRCEEFLDDDGRPLTIDYPTSLALCILDAIYATGSHPTAVGNVVDRYIAQHGTDDGAKSLRYSIAATGGPVVWAELVVCNLKPASTQPGAVLKAEVVDRATRVMADHGIDTVDDLLGAVGDDPFTCELSRSWLALPSQSSGISWMHLLMLAGSRHFEVDFRVACYVAELAETDVDLTVDYVLEQIDAAAQCLGVEAELIERIVWQVSHRRILSAPDTSDFFAEVGPGLGDEMAAPAWGGLTETREITRAAPF